MCSRVTFVNFTVTRSSLQSQCLHRVLKAERPDIDTKRSDLLKLQGKVYIHISHLNKNIVIIYSKVVCTVLANTVLSVLANLNIYPIALHLYIVHIYEARQLIILNSQIL